ncbi:MAG: hypothetical protein DDT19_02876 [Syntrophomonadaceae bacterium]|nr:hypothetical protein [Bacillota bacterium]
MEATKYEIKGAFGRNTVTTMLVLEKEGENYVATAGICKGDIPIIAIATIVFPTMPQLSVRRVATKRLLVEIDGVVVFYVHEFVDRTKEEI